MRCCNAISASAAQSGAVMSASDLVTRLCGVQRFGPWARQHKPVPDLAACAAGVAHSRRPARRGVPQWIAVDGVAPGIYRWPDLSAPLRSADLRAELERICLDQALAAEAAYVTIAATPLSTLDDRAYRDAQLAARLVEGRLHLAAHALGAAASGMTFLDSEVPGLLGGPDDLATLLFTCEGVPGTCHARAAGWALRSRSV
jgi:hypothetical protein